MICWNLGKAKVDRTKCLARPHLPEDEAAFHNRLDSVITPCIPVQLMAGKFRIGLDIDELHRDYLYAFACSSSLSCTGKGTDCSREHWQVQRNCAVAALSMRITSHRL